MQTATKCEETRIYQIYFSEFEGDRVSSRVIGHYNR